MFVYKVVAHYPDGRMTSSFIRAPGWRAEYKLGEITRGHPLPGRHRTPLLAWPSLEEAEFSGHNGFNLDHREYRILRCYTPRLLKPQMIVASGNEDCPSDAEAMARFWRNRRGMDYMRWVAQGVACPWLLPVEDMGVAAEMGVMV